MTRLLTVVFAQSRWVANVIRPGVIGPAPGTWKVLAGTSADELTGAVGRPLL